MLPRVGTRGYQNVAPTFANSYGRQAFGALGNIMALRAGDCIAIEFGRFAIAKVCNDGGFKEIACAEPRNDGDLRKQ